MWRKQDEPKASPLAPEVVAPLVTAPVRHPEPPRQAASVPGNISKQIRIKGEVTGSEDLVIEGEVHGSVRIPEFSVTIGTNGRVTADIEAREIVVRGHVEGKLHGKERVEIGRSGEVLGDIQTQRIAIEDGAYVSGKVDIARQAAPPVRAGAPTGTEASRPIPIRAQEA